MIKKILPLLFVLLQFSVYSQAIVKGSGVVYTNGAPTHSVNNSFDSELAIDTTTGFWYEHSRDGLNWLLAGFRIQKFPFSIPPTATPLDKVSEVMLNNVDSLYRWRSGAWHHLNPGAAYTAGTGIDITGGVITNTDPDQTVVLNNGTGISVTGTYPNFTITNTSPDQVVSITSGTGISVTGTYPNFTVTNTGDLSSTNELQVFTNSSDATNHYLVLSDGGGSLQFAEGTSIGFTTTGTGLDGIVTVNNLAPDQTVVLTAGAGISITGTYPNFTITATGGATGYSEVQEEGAALTARTKLNFVGSTATAVDDVPNIRTNVNFDSDVNALASTATTGVYVITATGSSTTRTITASTGISVANGSGVGGNPTITNTSPDQTVVLTNGAGITVTGTYPNFTITATDASITNEGLLGVGAGAANTSILLSNTSGAVGVTMQVGAGLSISETTSANGGNITITNTSPDQTVALTAGTGISITGTYPNFTITNSAPDQVVVLNNGTNITVTGTYPNFTINATSSTAYNEIQEEGSALTARTKLNFIGSSATAADNVPNTRTDVTFDSDLNALASTATTGLYVITGVGSSTTRTITAGTGISVANGSGVSGNPTITNTSPDQTVVLTAGAGVSITGTYPNFTITNTGDLSSTNEIQTYGHAGTTTYTNTLSIGGGTWSITGAGISAISQTAGAITVTTPGTDVFLNGISPNFNLNSSTGTGITLNSGTGILLTRTGQDLTIQNTGGVDLQTLASTSDATSHTVTLSNSGGSVKLVEGTNISLTTSGTGPDGIITIDAAGGGGGTPAGVTPNVQFNNGGVFGASPLVNLDSTLTRLLVGLTGSGSATLQTRGNSDVSNKNFLSENSSGNNIISVNNDGRIQLGDNEALPYWYQTNTSGGAISYTATGMTFEGSFGTTTDMVGLYHFEEGGVTTGTYNVLHIGNTFNPPTGNANYNQILLDPVIDNTASGNVISLNIDPTLTNASQYIAIRTDVVDDTDWWSFYGAGTADSRMGGRLGVGADPVAGFQLYSTGAIRADAALVSRGSGTTPASDLAVPQVRLWNTMEDTWYLSSLNSGDFRIESGAGTALTIDNGISQVAVTNTLKIGSPIGTPTTLIGRDGTGQVGTVTLGAGLTLTGGSLAATGGGGSGDILQNGNSFAAAFVIGTNDNNTVSLEQNGTTFFTGGTDKNVTLTNSVATTNTATDRFIIRTNSTGTAAANFGSNILFQAENSTTDNINQGLIRSYWKSAANGAEISAFDFQLMQGGGGLTTVASINRSGASTGMLEVGSTTPVQITNSALTSNTGYTIGSSSSALTIGGLTGTIDLLRTSANTITQVDFTVSTNSSGAAGIGFGPRMIMRGESSTTNNQEMGAISTVWTTATHATRTADMVFGTVISGGASVERLRLIGATGQVATNFSLKVGTVTGTPTTVIGRDGTGQVGTVTLNKDLNVVSGELNSSGLGTTAPTFTIATGMGTGSTSSIVGTDVAGEITITTGTGSITATQLGTINFGGNYDNTNYAVHLWASNLAASDVLNYLGFASTKNVGSCIVGGATSMASRLSVSTAYKIYYRITQYQ